MTNIKILTAVGGNKAGDTIDINDEAATYLVDNGYAEATKSTRGKSPTGSTNTTEKDPGGASSPVSPVTAG